MELATETASRSTSSPSAAIITPPMSALQMVYQTALKGSGFVFRPIVLDETSPAPYRRVCDFVNTLGGHLESKSSQIRPLLHAFTVREIQNSQRDHPREGRQLASTCRALEGIQIALSKPTFRGNDESLSFTQFVASCLQTMRTELLNEGYTDSDTPVPEYQTRWTRGSLEDQAMLSIRPRVAEVADNGDLGRTMSRAMHYRQHMWPGTYKANLSRGDVDYASETSLPTLLRAARENKGLWRVIQNLLSVATSLALEAGTISKHDTAVGEPTSADRVTFAVAACLSPLGVVAPFAVLTDAKTDNSVHKVDFSRAPCFCFG